MRGHIAKKGNKYYIVVNLGKDEATGKRKPKWLTGKDGKGFDRKKDAERDMPEILASIMGGTFVAPSGETFGEIMTQWLADKKSAVKYGTWSSYAWLINAHLIPNLGTIKLAKLQPQHLHQLYHRTLLPKLSVASIKKLHVLIGDALNRAVMWGMIPRNIAAAVELPKGKGGKFDVWDEAQLDAFLQAAKNDPYFLIFHLAANTGMRQSEILGLRWMDVDLANRTISVRQALTLSADGGHHISGTKTATSERSIWLFPDTVELLKAHKKAQAEQMMNNRKLYEDHGLVMQTKKGTPVNPRNLMRNYYNLLKLMAAQYKKKLEQNEPAVYVPKIRFHDLRHTHATILLKNDVHPKIVQERLGHSSITVTLDTYSHVLPNLQEAVLKGIGSSIIGDNFVNNRTFAD